MRSEWDGVKHVATLLQTGSSLHEVSKKSHVSFRAFGPLRDVKSLWNLVAAAVQSYPVGRSGARSVVAQRYCEVARRSIGSEWQKDEVVGQPSKVQNCERGFHWAKIVESLNMCP